MKVICRLPRGRAAGVSLAPHLHTQRRLLVVGRDLVVRTAALRGSLVALTAVAAWIGPSSVAAHQVAFEIWSFFAMALDALAIAALMIMIAVSTTERTTPQTSALLSRIGQLTIRPPTPNAMAA